MTRPIKIVDSDHKPIGELMTATNTEILKYISKGFTVIDRRTGEVITESDVSEVLGVSDGEMIME